MNKARKEAEEMILRYLSKITNGNESNANRYRELFKTMTDNDFDTLMKSYRDGVDTVQIQAPNLSDVKITVKNNLVVGKELGYDFFQRITVTDPATGQKYLSPKKHMILALPFKRQAQHLIKKISVATDNDSRDDLTGQPTGHSKGSTISGPELQVLYSLGLDAVIEELLKVRGGDEAAYTAMTKQAHATGGFSLKQASAAGDGVKATETLSAYLKACHINNNLI